MRRAFLVAVAALLSFGTRTGAAGVEVLQSIGGLPPHIVGLFEEPLAFQQTPDGPYYVFDRRAHSVYTVNPERTAARKLVAIGQELGKIIQPRGFDTSPTGAFVVADAPRGVARVQTFGPAGLPLNAFILPSRETTASITFGSVVLNGISSVQFDDERLLISHPESGALFTEYTTAGYPLRSIGRLRDTGFESDRDLHLALNVGLPVVDPTGGYFYVFMAGRPMFQKFDGNGRLLFERHIEGLELDEYLATMPTRWTTRRTEDRELPLVVPVIRAAAADARGQLWISLAQPFTYVYDGRGDKVRTVQFKAAGVISPTSLFFTHNGRLLVTPGCYEFKP
jgi:hypothetical protein